MLLAIRDVMNRHTRVHSYQQPEIVTGRTQRNAACMQCATSRVRCTRGDPCARCESKGLPCEPRVIPLENQGTGSEEHVVAEAHTTVDPQGSQPEKSPTTSLEPSATLPVDNQTWAQDPGFWRDSPVYGSQGRNLLDTGMTFDPGTYGVFSSDQLAPRHSSIINWLSPDDNILQEWASQLAGIPDGGIFPLPGPVPDDPSLPQLLCTEPPLGWAPTNKSTPDQTRVETAAAMASYPKPTDNEPPETLMDGQTSHSSETTRGKYYADGVAWRAPFQSRFRNGQVTDSVDRAGVTAAAPSTESVGSVATMDGTTSSLSKWMAEDVHARIVRSVEEETQVSLNLPSLQVFRRCVHLYFERLHPTFPFLRKATFINERPHWILSLAVAGVGAVYLRSPEGLQWKDSLMQVLDKVSSRRLHQLQHSVNTTVPANNILETANQMEEFLPLIQAKVLHLLCMLHSSTTFIAQHAMFERANLVQWCSYLSLVPDSADVFPPGTGKDTQQWVKEQSSLRTGMMIWVSELVRLRTITKIFRRTHPSYSNGDCSC